MNGDYSSNVDSGAVIKKDSGSTPNGRVMVYLLEAQDRSGNYIGLFTSALTSLTPTTYTITYASNGGRGSEGDFFKTPTNKPVYILTPNTDYSTITISNIHNGMADGTFKAQLSGAWGTTGTITITNGVFANVKILN
jgi:hypothetical protein